LSGRRAHERKRHRAAQDGDSQTLMKKRAT